MLRHCRVTLLITLLHFHLKKFQVCDRARKTVEIEGGFPVRGSTVIIIIIIIIITRNEMSGASSAYEGGERRVQGFGGET